ncbi:autophagy-related protein 27 [Moelleriella libera RCEF 2490]|uniref:Autophagy-related protein 27 n=1 Tax=Moelleriella libera RCEF 2490 TaxID=1081109 RepID=A0A168E055_9HYPO|nr:autophagy-related protein 27 [Moelleriella libera RCEF 2490]
MLHCENILIHGYKFNLEKLKGPHSVTTTEYDAVNTTYTLDICAPLKKNDKSKAKEQCPNGSRVCGIRRWRESGDDKVQVFAIAGALEGVGGAQFDYEVARLNESDSNSDSDKEGLRLILKGGKHPLDGPVGERREQKAIVEFLCDPSREGTEGEWETDGQYARADSAERKENGDNKDGGSGGGEPNSEKQRKKDNAALVWKSYKAEGTADVLRLTWLTKYACEKRDGDSDPDKDRDKDKDKDDASSHWGFFTWFVIVVFLGTASYLIFGSWLNYNRYGARGWDLVPHGDTIRDMPYLFKDWTRRVLNTVQGTGSRGGYSAV